MHKVQIETLKTEFDSVKECEDFLQDLEKDLESLEIASDDNYGRHWKLCVLSFIHDLKRYFSGAELMPSRNFTLKLTGLCTYFSYWSTGQRLFRMYGQKWDGMEICDGLDAIYDFMKEPIKQHSTEDELNYGLCRSNILIDDIVEKEEQNYA